MNPLKTLLAIALLVAAVPAAAQQVHIDYDPGYDRSQVETFAWMKTADTSVAGQNGLMHSRIVNAIEHYLSQAGVREVEADPDVWVTYHTDTEKEWSVDTDTMGYGYPGSWRWGGYWGPMDTTTTVRSYDRGTLIVDVWDAKTKKMVWRGSVSAVIPEKPAKLEKRIYKSLEKMVNKWHKIQGE